jgi:hypothetical protein
MKSIFAILAMVVGVSCFAEVFNIDKSRELYLTYYKDKTAANKAAWEKYVLETEFNSKLDDRLQQDKVKMMLDATYKGEMTKAGIMAAADKLYKLTDEGARTCMLVNFAVRKRAYDIIKAEIDSGAINSYEVLFNNACVYVANNFLSKRDYDNAIKYAEKVNPISQSAVSALQRAYGAKGMKDKAFEVGARLFLETYVTTPDVAMRVITSMMNQVPDNYDDAKLAELLAKIGKKYPAPGADFEAWKGFMGFIGYRYKALTGKDLFANSNK